MKPKLKEKVKITNNINNTLRKKKSSKKIRETKTLEEPDKVKINIPIKESNILTNNLSDNNNIIEAKNESEPKGENCFNRLTSKSNKIFNNIRSDYILKNIFEFLNEKRNLEIVRHNKELLERLDITIKDYKKYKNRIEIRIIPIKELKEEKNIFINFNEIISYIF